MQGYYSCNNIKFLLNSSNTIANRQMVFVTFSEEEENFPDSTIQ